jgi:hypothetical protein
MAGPSGGCRASSRGSGGIEAEQCLKRTTLILGAGASAPYGYPVGVGLRNALLENASGFDSVIADIGMHANDWKELQRLVQVFQRPSIDEFLAKYGERSQLVKVAIAHRLNRHESMDQHTSPQNSDCWYLRLLDEYLSNDPALGRGLLTVVTFNYDLSLEAYMFETIKVRHELTDEEARATVKALDVQHVYGHLGPLQSVHGAGRPYGPWVDQ